MQGGPYCNRYLAQARLEVLLQQKVPDPCGLIPWHLKIERNLQFVPNLRVGPEIFGLYGTPYHATTGRTEQPTSERLTWSSARWLCSISTSTCVFVGPQDYTPRDRPTPDRGLPPTACVPDKSVLLEQKTAVFYAKPVWSIKSSFVLSIVRCGVCLSVVVER